MTGKIRVTHIQFIEGNEYYMELAGPSTEVKPAEEPAQEGE